jgi:hypothetical protein
MAASKAARVDRRRKVARVDRRKVARVDRRSKVVMVGRNLVVNRSLVACNQPVFRHRRQVNHHRVRPLVNRRGVRRPAHHSGVAPVVISGNHKLQGNGWKEIKTCETDTCVALLIMMTKRT